MAIDDCTSQGRGRACILHYLLGPIPPLSAKRRKPLGLDPYYATSSSIWPNLVATGFTSSRYHFAKRVDSPGRYCSITALVTSTPMLMLQT